MFYTVYNDKTNVTETFRSFDEAMKYVLDNSLRPDSVEEVQHVQKQVPKTQLDRIASNMAEQKTTYAFHDQYKEAFMDGYKYAIQILLAVDR